MIQKKDEFNNNFTFSRTKTMSEVGLFDFEERCLQLNLLGNPLDRLNQAIEWESFRSILSKTHEKPRKDNSGRKPYDCVLMFKVLILQSLYNLSDDQMEYHTRDRISFMQFLGLKLDDVVPDSKTIWLFRQQLTELNLIKTLFSKFDGFLAKQGYTAKAGSIVDASIVEVPVQRNSREDNKQLKQGQIPRSFTDNPNKMRQKDVDARWIKKHNRSYFGYKNHVNVDVKHKLIRKYEVTAAAVHDSREAKEILDNKNSNKDVYGDSAYRSDEISSELEKKGFRDCIHRKGYRGNKLNERSRKANTRKSRIRARVEHCFGRISQFGRKIIRCVGLVRACAKIGLRNLVYNMDRYVRLAG
jgi:IS5 family transposase